MMWKMLSAKAGATFSMDCPELPLLISLSPSVINKAGAMRLKMLTIYNELVKNPPFPAWLSGLDEVWE